MFCNTDRLSYYLSTDPTTIVPSGTYLAWLSDGTDSPDTRFTKSSHTYILPNGKKISEDYTDLTDGSILHTINVDATGKSISGADRIWTDTMPDGNAIQQSVANVQSNSCNAWNGTNVYYAGAVAGSTSRKTGEWSNYTRKSCKYSGRENYRLACFQQ